MKDSIIMVAISAMVNQLLAGDQANDFATPLAPLTDGRVLLGRQHLKERSSPSRVVFVPIGGSFGPSGVNSQSVVQNGVKPGFQQRIRQRPLATEVAKYEVYCWGQANPADPDKDFDATRYLAYTVMRAMTLLAMTSVRFYESRWIDQQVDSTQMLKAGHEYVFVASIELPVPDSAVSIVKTDVLPGGLAVVPTVNVTSAGGGV